MVRLMAAVEDAYAAPSIVELLDLESRVALVTGAAQGFGFASARRLAEAGASVLLTDRRADRVEAAAGRLSVYGERVSWAVGDVSVRDAVDELIARAVELFGRLDILVNNAAAYSNVHIEEMPLDRFEGVLDVNVNGAFWCARQAARRMIDQGDGGVIVNVTSIDALHPTSRGMSHYTTSKHALWGLTKCLALELGPRGIRANAVAPGPSLTEGAIEYIQAGAPEGIDIEHQWAEAAARVPLRRWAEPDEIARVVAFLASDLSAYVNGAQIVVDGGYLVGS
jgi:2-dehydro-3-deoxy-D-gluconate 5-dehydrogenase